jgi:hypothetical protein
VLKEYVTESDKLQRTSNPSGDYQGAGIGEPKFNVDGTAYTGSWGRPQTDGPAIRATVLIEFANLLLDSGETDYVTSTLYDSLCKHHYPPLTPPLTPPSPFRNSHQKRPRLRCQLLDDQWLRSVGGSVRPTFLHSNGAIPRTYRRRRASHNTR